MGEAQEIDQSRLPCPEIKGNLMKIRFSLKWGDFLFIILGFGQHMVGSFHLSCSNMLRKWDEIVSSDGPTELDVWPYLQAMTSDVISRAAFGSSCEQGGKIFQLQNEQADCILQANRSLSVPGWRFAFLNFLNSEKKY